MLLDLISYHSDCVKVTTLINTIILTIESFGDSNNTVRMMMSEVSQHVYLSHDSSHDQEFYITVAHNMKTYLVNRMTEERLNNNGPSPF